RSVAADAGSSGVASRGLHLRRSRRPNRPSPKSHSALRQAPDEKGQTMNPLSPSAPPAGTDLSVFDSNPPELRVDSPELDAAYDEYDRRTAAGEHISIRDYIAQFPAELRSALQRVLQAHELLRSARYTTGDATAIALPEIGETVDGLLIKKELGRGGFGRVYLVWDKNTNRHDVLKLSVGSAEAKVAGPLTHSNIVPILTAP